MLCKSKAIVLTLATLLAAGCANSDRMSARNQQANWQPPERRPAVRTTKLVEPKILPETYFAAAQMFQEQGALTEAIRQYRKAIAVNHNYVAAYKGLGVLLSAVGRQSEAIELLRTATSLQPDDSALRNNLGFAYLLNHDWEAARDHRLDRKIPSRGLETESTPGSGQGGPPQRPLELRLAAFLPL